MIHQGNTEWEASFNTDNADLDCPSAETFFTEDSDGTRKGRHL